MRNHKQKQWIVLLLVLSGACGLGLSLYVHRPPTSLRSFHTPLSFTQQLAEDGHAGEKIFNHFCTTCHGSPPTIKVGAPLIGQKAWCKLKPLGVDTLLAHTREGHGIMPARGGCFECSDAELRLTIEYLLDHAPCSHSMR